MGDKPLNLFLSRKRKEQADGKPFIWMKALNVFPSRPGEPALVSAAARGGGEEAAAGKDGGRQGGKEGGAAPAGAERGAPAGARPALGPGPAARSGPG